MVPSSTARGLLLAGRWQRMPNIGAVAVRFDSTTTAPSPQQSARTGFAARNSKRSHSNRWPAVWEGEDQRRCRHCDNVGHFWRNCPTRPRELNLAEPRPTTLSSPAASPTPSAPSSPAPPLTLAPPRATPSTTAETTGPLAAANTPRYEPFLTIEFRDMTPKELISRVLEVRSTNIQPDELSSVLSIFVKLSGRSDMDGFSDVLKFIESKVPAMSSRGLATGIVSLAKLGVYGVPVVDKYVTCSLRNVQKFNNQELCNVICGLVVMRNQNGIDENGLALLDHLLEASALPGVIEYFKPQEISNILGALKMLNDVNATLPPIVESLCIQANDKAQYFNSQDVCMTLSALSKLDYYDPSLLRSLCSVSVKTAKDFRGPEVVAVLHSLAKFGHADDDLLDVFCTELLRTSRSLALREVSQALSALCILRRFDDELFSALVRSLNTQLVSAWGGIKHGKLTSEGLTQLNTAFTAIRVTHGKEKLAELKVSSELLAFTEEATRTAYAASEKIGPLHWQVSRVLRKLGIEHKNSVFVDGYIVSIQVPSSPESLLEGNVIIEVDGPSHFLRGAGNRPNIKVDRLSKLKGFYKLKSDLLTLQGYKVLHVPYFEWSIKTMLSEYHFQKKVDFARSLLTRHLKEGRELQFPVDDGKGGPVAAT